jgi:hypothetical protein
LESLLRAICSNADCVLRTVVERYPLLLMSSSTSLRSSPLAHLSALLTSSVGGGGGSSCTGSTAGGSSPSASFLTSLTNCVDGALGLVDDDDDNPDAATKNNKDEDEFVATKAAANVANDDCNSNNDQHKGTRRIATPCLIFLCEHDTLSRYLPMPVCLVPVSGFFYVLLRLAQLVLSRCKWYPSIISFFSLIHVRPRCTITITSHS